MGICILRGTLRLVNLNYVSGLSFLCPALLIYTLVEVEGVGVDIAVGAEEIV